MKFKVVPFHQLLDSLVGFDFASWIAAN